MTDVIEFLAEMVIDNNLGNYAAGVVDCGETDSKQDWSEFGTATETAQAVLGEDFFEQIAERVTEIQATWTSYQQARDVIKKYGDL